MFIAAWRQRAVTYTIFVGSWTGDRAPAWYSSQGFKACPAASVVLRYISEAAYSCRSTILPQHTQTIILSGLSTSPVFYLTALVTMIAVCPWVVGYCLPVNSYEDADAQAWITARLITPRINTSAGAGRSPGWYCCWLGVPSCWIRLQRV